jgi:hypothetical protein
MPVEGDCLSDAEALRNHEAQRIAERVRLVLVVAEERDGAQLVVVDHVYDLAQAALDMLQEAKSGLSSFAGTVREQRLRLVDDGIRCDEMPALSFGLREQLSGPIVERVL